MCSTDFLAKFESMTDNELNALINLLEDPDEEVFSAVKDQILSMGSVVIPALEHVWENTFNNILQGRIEDVIHTIQMEQVKAELMLWVETGSNDLLAGTLLISRYQYPDLDTEYVRKQIDLIRRDVWLEINQNLTAYEKVKIINHILFDVYNFSGNTSNYHAPQNSFINNVLESKKGNPLLLSIVYSVIAQGLNIPIYGVNLPEHFILAYRDEYSIQQEGQEEAILFYINPFSRGTVFSRREIDTFLKQLKLEPNRIFYESCPNIDIVSRQVRNLVNSFEKLGYPNKVSELKELLVILSGHPH